MSVMVSLKTSEELERTCKSHESSSNSRKHAKLNKPQGRALKHQWILPLNLIHLVMQKERDDGTHKHKSTEITGKNTMLIHITTRIPQNAAKPWFISLPNCRSDVQLCSMNPQESNLYKWLKKTHDIDLQTTCAIHQGSNPWEDGSFQLYLN